ncbi:glycylpeptide N-tetradecanoyltransferase [Dipsacomyces acuminosporus]|nr:glycylpeptide N-tetradecanoyltransferase [Dipsacomyces acuminosporus]
MSEDKSGNKEVPTAAPLDNAKLRELIKRLEAQSVGDSTLTKLEREAEAEEKAVHKFWDTQPVPKSSEVIKKDGPLHPALKPEEIPKDPYPLPENMEWCLIDVEVEEQMKELYDLLTENYVEDSDSMFRFNYSSDFLKWALLPPGTHKDWHIGVRESTTKELLAFISGIPIDLMVRDKTVTMAEINFLCVNKTLRNQRLAPLLIQEVTRRVHLVGIFQAVYTAGRLLPKPVSTCRYFHRSLNPKKLMETGFSQKLEGPQLAKLLTLMRLPSMTSTPGLRAMRKGDVGQVRKLLNRYLKNRCDVVPIFRTDAEVAHWFLPRDGVIWTYVVDDQEHPGRISDFFSFYSLPSSVLKPGSTRGKGKRAGGNASVISTINAAYCFYYGTKTDYQVSLTDEEKQSCEGHQKKEKALLKEKESQHIKERLVALMHDALVLAKEAQFDVFNCLHMMDNAMFTEDLRFGAGDGHLRYYFFNWLARPVEPNKVGLVML